MGRAETIGADIEQQVEDALGQVQHPSLGTDIHQAGFVHDIVVDGQQVVVELDETALDPSITRGLSSAVCSAVQGIDPVTDVLVQHVRPESAAGSTHDHDPTEAQVAGTDGTETDDPFAAVDEVIAVASAKGGVGKSTVAVQLACALAADRDVGVFDADIYGPNVPTLLDIDGPVHADEAGNPQPIETGGLEAMSVGLLTDGGPLAWRGSVAHEAVTDLLTETEWGNRDVVVLDLPPGTGDVVLTILQEARVDGVVFVSTPFQASVEDTQRSVTLFEEEGVPVLGTVMNMANHTCPSCGDNHALFAEASDTDLDVPVLAELPFSNEMQETATPGNAPAAFESLAESVTERLVEASHMSVPADALDIRGLAPEDRYEAVREAFETLNTGETFYLISDRDPTPVREYLSELTNEADTAFEPFDVERQGREKWVLRTVRP